MSKVIVTPHPVDLEAPRVATAILQHITDIVGEDRRGRSILRCELAAKAGLFDKLACYGAREEDLLEDDDA